MPEKMKRLHIFLTPAQRKVLDEIATRKSRSISSLVRDIIDEYISSRPQEQLYRLTIWRKERDFIASLSERGPVKGGRTWKREDLYE